MPTRKKTIPNSSPRARIRSPFLLFLVIVVIGTVIYLLLRLSYAQPGQGNPKAIENQSHVTPGTLTPLGEAKAPVTLVIFSDMQCPFCRSFYANAYQDIKREYVDSGKVKIYFRHFPLATHATARKSAEALSCANDQGFMWQFHDLMFDKQQEIDSRNTVEYSVDDIKDWARDLPLNTAMFDTCLDSGKYIQAVEQDMQDGLIAGINGTPSIFINDSRIIGSQPFEAYRALIDQKLAK